MSAFSASHFRELTANLGVGAWVSVSTSVFRVKRQLRNFRLSPEIFSKEHLLFEQQNTNNQSSRQSRVYKGAFFKDKRSLGGMGCQPGAVTISDSDVIIISNNDVIVRSEGGGGKKRPKN